MKLLHPALGLLIFGALLAESKKCKEYSKQDIEDAFVKLHSNNKRDLEKIEASVPVDPSAPGGGTYVIKSKAERRKLFKEKVKAIIKANRRANKTYCQAPNKFTLMDEAEFNHGFLGRLPGEGNLTADFVGTPRQYEEIKTKPNGTVGSEPTTLPDFVSYKDYAGPVNDQNGCGNCWAFGGGHTVSITLSVLKGEHPTDYSEQQLMDCVTAAPGCDGGGFATYVFNYLRDHQFQTESQYPYKAADGPCQMTLGGGNRPVMSWFRSHNFGYPNPRAMKEVVSVQPMVAAMWVDPDFVVYKGGVYQPAWANCSSGWKVNHEITIIGYGTDPEAGDYWLVKNSWGADWGEYGFGRIKRGQNVCNIEIDARYVTPKETYKPNTTPAPTTGTTTNPPHCVNHDALCDAWEIYCNSNTYVIQNCKLTCGRCSNPTTKPSSQCVDEKRQCAYYGSPDCISGSYNGDKQTTEDGTPCLQFNYGDHKWPKPCTNRDDDQAPWCFRAGHPNWDYCFPPCSIHLK